MKLIGLIFALLCLFTISCSRDPEFIPNSTVSSNCRVFNETTSDTNYMPHQLGDTWSYSFCNINYAGWEVWIKHDTLIGSNKILTIGHYAKSTHAPSAGYDSFSMIDSVGNYYILFENGLNTDTVLLIKNSANNGDTIYNKSVTDLKVVVINKNEIIDSVSNCYHSRLFYQGHIEDHYFKRGIGELYFGSAKLIDAKIK